MAAASLVKTLNRADVSRRVIMTLELKRKFKNIPN